MNTEPSQKHTNAGSLCEAVKEPGGNIVTQVKGAALQARGGLWPEFREAGKKGRFPARTRAQARVFSATTHARRGTAFFRRRVEKK